jgi:hypothetical protein
VCFVMALSLPLLPRPLPARPAPPCCRGSWPAGNLLGDLDRF